MLDLTAALVRNLSWKDLSVYMYSVYKRTWIIRCSLAKLYRVLRYVPPV